MLWERKCFVLYAAAQGLRAPRSPYGSPHSGDQWRMKLTVTCATFVRTKAPTTQ